MTRRDFAVSGTSVSYGDYYTIAPEHLARANFCFLLLFSEIFPFFLSYCTRDAAAAACIAASSLISPESTPASAVCSAPRIAGV